MKNLIEIKEVNGKKLVSARDLHEFLESKQEFTNWIKNRIKQYGFVENEDFTIDKFIMRKTWKHDYIISIDMAKELSMVEQNAKGREARKYFIECEKQLKEISEPKSNLDLLELQVKALKEVESKVEKVDRKFDELPLFKVDSKSLTKLANSKMVALLGGKGTNAYKTLNRKAFSDMYKQLHREFGINSIDEIKRKDLEYAKKVICDYTLPFKLKNEVKMLNSQMKFNTEVI